MRKLLIAAMAALFMGLAAPAFAGSGPAGTSEGVDEDDVNTNQVECGTKDADDVDAMNGIMLKTEGDQEAPQDGGAIVLCNDGEAAPIQGRIIATGDTNGGYVAADGDADNEPDAEGYARVDVAADGSTPVAPRCGDVDAADTDSANPDGAGAGTVGCVPSPA